MPRRADPDEPEDPPEDEEEEDGDDEEEAKKKPAAHRARRASAASSHRRAAPTPTPRRPIRAWRSGKGDADELEENRLAVEEAELAADRPRSSYWTFRDSFWFAPVVAIVIILLVMGGLIVYTQSWPPVYVVESMSMQHGTTDQLGLINTGDLVLSKKVAYNSIVTYVAAIHTGYSTYGELGDVVLYQPNGASVTPIIHRALIYLEYNANGTYSAPSLSGLGCGTGAGDVYQVQYSQTPLVTGCSPVGMSGTLVLSHIGWKSAEVPIPLGVSTLGNHSGFVTLGDNNVACSSTCIGAADQAGAAPLSRLVGSNWVVGVARGMIPWFGSLRLLLSGSAGEVPSQSWEFMALSIVAILLAAFGLHYAWSSFRPVDPRRTAVRAREAEEEEAKESRDDEDESEEATPRRRWFWQRARGDDEEPARTSKGASASKSTRGRPKPAVRRPPKGGQGSKGSDDEDNL